MFKFVTVTFLINLLDKKFKHKHTLMLTHPLHTRLSEAGTVKCQNILFLSIKYTFNDHNKLLNFPQIVKCVYNECTRHMMT